MQRQAEWQPIQRRPRRRVEKPLPTPGSADTGTNTMSRHRPLKELRSLRREDRRRRDATADWSNRWRCRNAWQAGEREPELPGCPPARNIFPAVPAV